MTDLSALPPDLQQRYGYKKSTFGRTLFSIVMTGVIVAGGMFVYLKSKTPDVGWSLRTFVVTSDTKSTVSWQVSRPAKQVTYCVLRAQDINRNDVGYATVTIAAGDPVENVTYQLSTESKPILIEVLACSASPTMRVAPAHFPPGVAIPAQDPPGVAPTS